MLSRPFTERMPGAYASAMSAQHEREPDPTLMRNQPALRTSSGTIWLIMGAALVVISLVPLTLIILAAGPATGAAMTTAALIVVVYAGMIVVRLTITASVPRLRLLAAGFLAIAAVALIGMLICVAIERGTV